MTSSIDATKPADAALAAKDDARSNWAALKSEIEDLQAAASLSVGSSIDATEPAAGSPTVKADFRSNLTTAKSELEAIFTALGSPTTVTVDTTKPVDGVAASKDAMRDNWLVLKNAVESAQALTSLDAGSVEVFGLMSFTPTALTGWPSGATVTGVKTQGSYANGYWRGHGNKASRTDEVDVYARDAKGSDTIVLETTGGDVSVAITVTDANTGTLRYLDSEFGSDGNDGTSAGAGAWSTWQHACANAPANSTVVVKGRSSGGAQLAYQVAATNGVQATVANSGVTFKGDPDDVAAGTKPAIWALGGQYQTYRTTGIGNWEVHDAGNNIWRSVATGLTEPESLTAFYKAPNGRWVRLYFYVEGGLTQLAARSEGRQTAKSEKYKGPGIVQSGGRIYVRLEEPTNTHNWWANASEPSYTGTADDWDFDAQGWLPTSLDPNDTEFIVTGGAFWDPGPNLSRMTQVSSKSNTTFRNLECWGCSYSFELTGTMSGTTFQGLTMANACIDLVDDFNVSFAPMNINIGSSGVTGTLVDRCYATGGLPPWVTYFDGKSAEKEGGSMRPSFYVKSSALSDITVRNSVVTQFNLHFAWGGNAGNELWYNNELSFGQSDGAWLNNLTANPGNIRWYRNLMWAMTLWGTPGGIAAPAGQATPDSCQFAYNVLTQVFWNNAVSGLGPDSLLVTATSSFGVIDDGASETDGRSIWRYNIHHGNHNDGQRYGVSQSFYNNTWVTHQGHQWYPHTGAPLGSMFRYPSGGFCRGYNNICAALDAGFNPSADNAQLSAAQIDDPNVITNSVYDGNHYYLDAAGISETTESLVVVYTSNSSGGTPKGGTAYNSMSALRAAHPTLEASGTGGTASGDDPDFAGLVWPEPFALSQYELQVGSPCSSGAVDISANGWAKDIDAQAEVSLVHRIHRGAVDPDIPLIEQEVGPL